MHREGPDTSMQAFWCIILDLSDAAAGRHRQTGAGKGQALWQVAGGSAQAEEAEDCDDDDD
jgi:hypothetical protein